MGRIRKIASVTVLVAFITTSLVSCENPLQTFIVDTLFGAPYQRQMARLVPDPNQSSFGFSVDISGDYMIVGEPNRDGGKGGATMYHRTSGETWDAGTLIPAPEGALGPHGTNANDGDQYGIAVATDGNFAVIGSMYSGDTTGIKRGRVAIYKRDTTSGSWTLVDDFGLEGLSGATPAALDYDMFGNAISIDGSWMVIGARQDQNGVVDDSCGAVYLFQNVGGTWTFKEKHRAPVPQDGSLFGSSVDISGNSMIVGALNEDVDGTLDDSTYEHGAAYLFAFEIDGWVFQQRLVAPDASSESIFGTSVGISGDYVVVGSPWKDINNVSNAGGIYIFQRSASGDWNAITAASIELAAPASEDWFGFSVAIRGDQVMASSMNRDDAGANAGAVYLYSRTDGNAWELSETITAADAGDNGFFGMSLAMDDERAVIGATDLSTASEGAVYVFK